jgi:hypothetical protein
MATRKHLTHDQKTRERIQTSQIINRLEDHIFNGLELSATQIQAAKILLAKAIPDLKALEVNGNVEHRYMMRSPEPEKTTGDWSKKWERPTVQ